MTRHHRSALVLGLLGILALVIVALGTGEALARRREWTRTTVPGTMPLLYYRHRRLPHALARNSDYFGWVQINRWGFRGPDIELAPRPGSLRIMAVGGSTTYDSQARDNDNTWPARLGARLNDSGIQPTEIINAGVPGYTVIDNLIRLEMGLYAFSPNVVILYHAHNDLFAALISARQSPESTDRSWSRPGEIPTVLPWVRWLEHHSLFYTKLQGRIRALAFLFRGRRAANDSSRIPDWTAVIEHGANKFRRDLRAFLAVAQSQGIRVAIPQVVHISASDTTTMTPAVREMWERSVPYAPVEVVLAGYQAYNTVLREVADEYQAWYFPLDASALSQPDGYAFGDPIHFNDIGSDRMAAAVADAIQASILDEFPNTAAAGSTRVQIP